MCYKNCSNGGETMRVCCWALGERKDSPEVDFSTLFLLSCEHQHHVCLRVHGVYVGPSKVKSWMCTACIFVDVWL